MRAAFEGEARRLLDELRAVGGATARVKEAVSSKLDGGPACMETTARGLGMSVATRRRRLADEGTTFSAVVRDVRHEMATEYLRSGRASVGEVAGQLGFSGVAAFGRAFKRWTGSTPSHYRWLPTHEAPGDLTRGREP